MPDLLQQQKKKKREKKEIDQEFQTFKQVHANITSRQMRHIMYGLLMLRSCE